MKNLLPVLAAVILSTASSAFGWAAPGHMIVAAIAYDELSPAECAKLAEIMKGHPEHSRYAGEYRNIPGVPWELFELMVASTYPDAIRDYKNPETHALWHFTDYPLLPPDFPMKPRPEPQNDVVFGIGESVKVAKNAAGDPIERAKMLSFVLHLIGDIHQPLHCETLFNQDFPEPKGDRGGNYAFILVPPDIKEVNLHAFWDDQFGKSQPFGHLPPPEMVAQARKDASAIEKKYPREKLPELKTHTTPESWALESRTAAIHDAWLNGKLPYAKRSKTHLPAPVPPAYAAHALEVSEKRIALAGHRLADALHEILK